MPNPVETYASEASALIAQARALHETAAAEKRTLTPEEEEKFHKLMMDAGALRARAERERTLAAESAWLERSVSPSIKPPLTGTTAPDSRSGFRSLGHFVAAVRFPDEFRAGMSLGVGTAGGYLVPAQFVPGLLAIGAEGAIVRPRATVIPAGDAPDATVTMAALDQGANGVFGGVTVTWIAEGGAKPETTPILDEVSLTPKELAAHTVLSDRLIRNADSASPIVERLLGGAIQAAVDYAALRGNGVGKPLGVVGAPGTIAVVRNTGADIKYVDVVTMLSRLNPESWDNALLSASITTLPKLASLADGAGNTIWIQGNAEKKIPSTLLGFPVRFTGRLPVLGNEGDLTLADWRYYLLKDGSGPAIAASEHVHFTSNKTVIKVYFCVDGQPWVKAPMLLEDGATTVSPFVTLK